jgi:hypothetical protein
MLCVRVPECSHAGCLSAAQVSTHSARGVRRCRGCAPVLAQAVGRTTRHRARHTMQFSHHLRTGSPLRPRAIRAAWTREACAAAHEHAWLAAGGSCCSNAATSVLRIFGHTCGLLWSAAARASAPSDHPSRTSRLPCAGVQLGFEASRPSKHESLLLSCIASSVCLVTSSERLAAAFPRCQRAVGAGGVRHGPRARRPGCWEASRDRDGAVTGHLLTPPRARRRHAGWLRRKHYISVALTRTTGSAVSSSSPAASFQDRPPSKVSLRPRLVTVSESGLPPGRR